MAEPAAARGPRALRSQALPWGVPAVSAREQRQVDLGNVLLRSTVSFLYAAWAASCPAVMEHPARPWWNPSAPSCWLLPELVHLRSLVSVCLVQVDQCMLGASWRKPTGLLAVACPKLGELRAMQCDGLHVHASLMGAAAEGGYRTAEAKQYPRQMCAALARAFLSNFAGRLSATVEKRDGREALSALPPQLARFFVPLDPYRDDQVWGAFQHDCCA